MDPWLLAKPIHSLLYGTSVFLSLVYVSLKVSRDCFSKSGNRDRLLLVAVACSFLLYGSFKTLVSFTTDARNHPDLITWLQNLELGDHKVQRITTQSTLGHWFYSQLMGFILPFITFINIKSRLARMPTIELCAYVWLAMGGAVSLAFPLFLLRYNSTVHKQTSTSLPLRLPTWGMDVLGICLWISFWCTVSLPSSKEEEVSLYMSLLRWVLFLPSLVPATPVKNRKDHSMPLPIYCALAVLITGYHWYQSIKVIMGESQGSFHHNQAVLCDFVFCFFSLVLHIFYDKRLGFVASLAFIFLIPFLSLGSTFSLLVIYEVYLHKEEFSTSLKEE